MLRRILVPLDGSRLAETALPYALTCAQATDSHIILVHVLQTAKGDGSDAHTVDPLDWRLRKLEASMYLEEISTLFADTGIEAEPVLLMGEAPERIVEFARERDVDLIVMSSHGKTGLSSWNVSSVVQKVLQTTHTSMMVIPAYYARNVAFGELRHRRIVVPLDGSQRAECVVPIVKAFVQAHGAEAFLLTIVARPEMVRRAPLSTEEIALADKIVDRNRAAAEKYLAHLQTRIDTEASSHLLVSDDVTESLHEFVRRQEADLVVFSAHGSSGNRKRRYGSVVTNFIAYGSVPLLIIQDIPPEEIKKTAAEVVAEESANNGMGARTVVNAPAAA